MKKSGFPLILLLGYLLLSGTAVSQPPAAVDSLKKALARATTVEDKAYLYDYLARTVMNVNIREADSLGDALILLAEESRDRKLMFDAYVSNGIRCGYMRGQKAFIDRAIGYYEKAMSIARQNSMDKRVGAAQLLLADIYLAVPDKEKALKYAAEAFSRLSATKDDSLKVQANNVYGKVYLARNEKILALRHYLTALDIAEEIKPADAAGNKMKNELMRDAYLELSGFYASIGDFDMAIDKYSNAYALLDKIDDKGVPYQRCIDINAIGNLFAQKKNYDIAISYFNRSIRMADSLKFGTLKLPGYLSLLNQYLRMDQPQKALQYLNSPDGREMKKFLENFRMTSMFDQAYAYVYTEMGQYDSARKYFQLALPFFENSLNENARMAIYLQLAKFYSRTGETDKAIEYFLKGRELGEKNSMLEIVMGASKKLDSLYRVKGDFKSSTLYNEMYYRYKDSIDNLNKEKELSKAEADAEQLRQNRLDNEQKELQRRKNNIQYMAIIFGILLLFVTLVVLGMFKVSAGLIKAIGFFVFLMLFEFIFLVFKKKIYYYTNGEPWKDLLFMIGLAALLVPLHHWLEHRVLHYLTSHNRLTSAGHQIKKRLFRGTNGDTE